MRKLFILGILLPLMTLVSCGDERPEGEDGLILSLPEQRFILPGSGDSCAALYDSDLFDDISPHRLSINNVKLSWDRTAENLSLIFARVEITHANLSGGKFEATITGDELDLVFGSINGNMGAASRNAVDGTAVPVVGDSNDTNFIGQTGDQKRPCGLNYGSIGIVDEDTYFTATAKIIVVGIASGNGFDGVTAGQELADGEEPVADGEERAVKVTQTMKVQYKF